MAFEYGFYNSIGGDRKYNAIQFGQIFDGIINDGVFLSIGEKFATLVTSGMEITVGTGKAWFNHTWNLNTTKIPITLSASHPVLTRYDAVVLEVNDSPDISGRVNAIKLIEGSPSSNPVKPALANSEYIHQYPLSYIKINPGVTSLTAADIEIMVGQDPCPYVTGILQTTDITELFNNWESQFTIWFDNLKAQLSDDIVTNLQNQIDQCLKPEDIATMADIENGTAGKLVDAELFKNKSSEEAYKIGDIKSTWRTDLGENWALCNGDLIKREGHEELYDLNFNFETYLESESLYNLDKSTGKVRFHTIYKDCVISVVEPTNPGSPLIYIENLFTHDYIINQNSELGSISSSIFHASSYIDGDTFYLFLFTGIKASSGYPDIFHPELFIVNGDPLIESNWNVFLNDIDRINIISYPKFQIYGSFLRIFDPSSNYFYMYNVNQELGKLIYIERGQYTSKENDVTVGRISNAMTMLNNRPYFLGYYSTESIAKTRLFRILDDLSGVELVSGPDDYFYGNSNQYIHASDGRIFACRTEKNNSETNAIVFFEYSDHEGFICKKVPNLSNMYNNAVKTYGQVFTSHFVYGHGISILKLNSKYILFDTKVYIILDDISESSILDNTKIPEHTISSATMVAWPPATEIMRYTVTSSYAPIPSNSFLLKLFSTPIISDQFRYHYIKIKEGSSSVNL